MASAHHFCPVHRRGRAIAATLNGWKVAADRVSGPSFTRAQDRHSGNFICNHNDVIAVTK